MDVFVVSWGAASLNANVSTVHVILSISNCINPGPSKGASFTTGQSIWNFYWPFIVGYALNEQLMTYSLDKLHLVLESNRMFYLHHKKLQIGKCPKVNEFGRHFGGTPPCRALPENLTFTICPA